MLKGSAWPRRVPSSRHAVQRYPWATVAHLVHAETVHAGQSALRRIKGASATWWNGRHFRHHGAARTRAWPRTHPRVHMILARARAHPHTHTHTGALARRLHCLRMGSGSFSGEKLRTYKHTQACKVVRTHTQSRTHKCARTHSHSHPHSLPHKHTHTRARTLSHTRMRTHTTHTFARTRTHTYTNTRSHARTHIHEHTPHTHNLSHARRHAHTHNHAHTHTLVSRERCKLLDIHRAT